jgi:hypothetical protein
MAQGEPEFEEFKQGAAKTKPAITKIRAGGQFRCCP